MNVKVCHGVGGSFDVLAGRTTRAPALWQRFGLEWLFRLLQEPRRMARRYAVTNVAFLRLLLIATVSQRLPHRP
jgi:N-acetylglucosaminyldiphosphoundecaprenol N-acetyl-beta-D-mannosaminyltransferase